MLVTALEEEEESEEQEDEEESGGAGGGVRRSQEEAVGVENELYQNQTNWRKERSYNS